MAPHRWRSARVLDAVRQVNGHLVSAFIELARSGSAATVVVARNLDDLCRLDATASRRAARMPILLLDLNFQRDDWWRIAASLGQGVREATENVSGLPADLAAELTREVLIVAWLAVNEDRQAAKLMFGMSDTVAAVISELTPQQLDRAAARSSQQLQIRWENKSEFWPQLLAAARSGDADDLCEIYLRGIQLLGGELISVRR